MNRCIKIRKEKNISTKEVNTFLFCVNECTYLNFLLIYPSINVDYYLQNINIMLNFLFLKFFWLISDDF